MMKYDYWLKENDRKICFILRSLCFRSHEKNILFILCSCMFGCIQQTEFQSRAFYRHQPRRLGDLEADTLLTSPDSRRFRGGNFNINLFSGDFEAETLISSPVSQRLRDGNFNINLFSGDFEAETLISSPASRRFRGGNFNIMPESR